MQSRTKRENATPNDIYFFFYFLFFLWFDMACCSTVILIKASKVPE